jgi:hypothetical protein
MTAGLPPKAGELSAGTDRERDLEFRRPHHGGCARGQRGGFLWLFIGLMATLGAPTLILGVAFGQTG